MNLHLQEIKCQGLGEMTGLRALLKSSGTGGKHPQNIKRDMLRSLAKKKPEPSVPMMMRNKFCIYGHIFKNLLEVEAALDFVLNSWLNVRICARCRYIMSLFHFMRSILMATGSSTRGPTSSSRVFLRKPMHALVLANSLSHLQEKHVHTHWQSKSLMGKNGKPGQEHASDPS